MTFNAAYGALVCDFTRQENKGGLKPVDGFERSDVEGIRYIGDAEFGKDPDVYEVRMQNGIVDASGNGHGEADLGFIRRRMTVKERRMTSSALPIPAG